MPEPRAAARWIPVVLWAGVISFLSTEWFSAEQTRGVVLPILRWLLPAASPTTLRAVHAATRKLAHVTEYLVLSLLLSRALRASGTPPRQASVLAVVIAAGYALLDELHQLATPGRTAAFTDCLLDASGAATGQLLAAALRARSTRGATS